MNTSQDQTQKVKPAGFRPFARPPSVSNSAQGNNVSPGNVARPTFRPYSTARPPNEISTGGTRSSTPTPNYNPNFQPNVQSTQPNGPFPRSLSNISANKSPESSHPNHLTPTTATNYPRFSPGRPPSSLTNQPAIMNPGVNSSMPAPLPANPAGIASPGGTYPYRPAGTPRMSPSGAAVLPGVPIYNSMGAPGVPVSQGMPPYNQGRPPYNGTPGPAQSQGMPPYNSMATSGVAQPQGMPPYNSMGVPGPAQSQGMPPYNSMGVPGPAGVSGMVNDFQQMNLKAQQQPVGVNLMAGPPPITDFDKISHGPDLEKYFSGKSPFSNPSSDYKACSLNHVPSTNALLDQSKLPFGLLVSPFHELKIGEPEVPIVQSPQIIRCRRCRTYLNPWVQFIEQDTRWKCNMCFLNNDIPSTFDWDESRRVKIDRNQRPEITHGVVEYIAPQEYMVRAPQPVVILFLIDVSVTAVQSGMLAVAAHAILSSLDKIHNNDDRTKVGFITFDNVLHFYDLAAGNTEPRILTVSDTEDPFLPQPEDLLVSLTDSRTIIESLLKKLPVLFQANSRNQSCLGSALKCAEKLIGPIGGKIIALQSELPNMEPGLLKMREDPSLFGTAKEKSLLQPANTFYKNVAIDCSPLQVSIDLFLFNGKYGDIATLSNISKFTGGGVYYYPGFDGTKSEDAIKFGTELSHVLSRPLGLEAVLRIRASKGIKMTTFHGNFFLRSSDLLSLPNVNPDNMYTIELGLTEDIKSPNICFQTALLYTSSSGERRIRVITMCLPVTSNINDLYINANCKAMASLLVKKAVDRAIMSQLEDSREALRYKLVEILTFYKNQFKQATHPQQLMISENLRLLGIYILAMIKNTAFKESRSIGSDLRSYYLTLQYSSITSYSLNNIYPSFWALRDFIENKNCGTVTEDGMVFPNRMNLSSEKLDRGGIFLLENGQEFFIWIGSQAPPEILGLLFGQRSADLINVGNVSLPILDNDLNARVRAFIEHIRGTRLREGSVYPKLVIVREGGDPKLRMMFLAQLIEDRVENLPSYPQFMASIRDDMQKAK